jgi:hypothetical protein
VPRRQSASQQPAPGPVLPFNQNNLRDPAPSSGGSFSYTSTSSRITETSSRATPRRRHHSHQSSRSSLSTTGTSSSSSRAVQAGSARRAPSSTASSRFSTVTSTTPRSSTHQSHQSRGSQRHCSSGRETNFPRETKDCMACLDPHSIDDFPPITATCTHLPSLCTSCVQDALTATAMDAATLNQLRCMHQGCTEILSHDDIRRLATQQTFER